MAYEAFSDEFKRTIEPLYLIHDTALGKAFPNSSPEEQAKSRQLNPPTAHPVVRVHPDSGRKSLYIGERVRSFVGMTEEESRPLYDFLMQHATRYEFTYRHRWTPNDFIMWDNRCSLHFAVHDYEPGQPRNMLRCSIDGPKLGYAYTEDDALGVPATAS
jgi:taurine dioxygenase